MKLTFATIDRKTIPPKKVEIALTDGRVAEFWLVPFTGPRRERAIGQALDLIARFIDGNWLNESINEVVEEPETFPQIGGEEVVLSERLFHVLCQYEAMQAPPNAADAYTWEDLIYLMVNDPAAWDRLQVAVIDVGKSGKAMGS